MNTGIKTSLGAVALALTIAGGANIAQAKVPNEVIDALMKAGSMQGAEIGAADYEVHKSSLLKGVEVVELKFKKDFYTFYERYYYKDGTIFPEPQVFFKIKDGKPVLVQDSKTPSHFDIDNVKDKGSFITIGNPLADANNTIYEFVDMQCPFCKRVHPLIKEYIQNHPEKRVVYINFPLTSIHPLAADMAMTTKAAFDFDKKFGEALFEGFLSTNSANYNDMMRVVQRTMKEVYGDKFEEKNKAFKKFVQEKGDYYSKWLKDHLDSIGFVPGTPFFVNGNGEVLQPTGGPNGAFDLKAF